jgi:uncharacterized protein (TIGR03067 family)
VFLACLALGLLSAGLAIHGVSAGDTQKDQERLQGIWKATRVIVNGTEVPEDVLKGITVTIRGNEINTAFKGDDQDMNQKASFKLDPSKKPKQIDLVPADGPEKGKKLEGIYEIEGDTLRMAIAPPIGESKRPENFNAAEGSTAFVMTFQRAKK